MCIADAGLTLMLILPTHLHMQVVRGEFQCRDFGWAAGWEDAIGRCYSPMEPEMRSASPPH